MAEWRFYDYVDGAGAVPFVEWIRTLPADVQAHIDVRLLYLEKRPQWNDKLFKKYQGHDGIYEVIITFKRVEYRPLVSRHPTDGKGFVFLVGAIEQNWKLKPASALGIAKSRKEEIENDPGRAKPHSFEA